MRRILEVVALVVSIVFSAAVVAQAAPVLYWGGGTSNIANGTLPAGGAGTWNTTTSNWSSDLLGTYQAWSTGGDIAYFGTAGSGPYPYAVTLSNSGGTIPAVDGLIFAAGGYTLSPSTTEKLTLEGTPGIDVRQGAATIAAVLDDGGSALTITKNGAGLLYLSGVNTFGATVASKLVLSNGYLRADGSGSVNAFGSSSATLELQGGGLLLTGATGLNYGRNTTVSGSTLVLLDRGATGAGVTDTFGTLGIGSQTMNVWGTAWTNNSTGSTAGLTYGATTLSGDPVFNVRNRTNGGATLLTLGAVGGTGNITTAGSGNVTFSSTVGTGSGTITVFEGTTTFTDAVSSTGAFKVYNGTAILAGTTLPTGGISASLASTDIQLLGGRLQLGSATNQNNVSRLTGTPKITLGGGTLYLNQPNTTPAATVNETVGQLVLKPGQSSLALTGGTSGAYRLLFDSLGTRDMGSMIGFANPGNYYPVRFSNPPPALTGGIIGGWAVNGQSWATVAIPDPYIATDVSSYTYVTPFDSNDINTPGTGNNNIDQSLASAGVLMANTQTINSLRLTSSASPNALNLNQNTLTLATGGLMANFTATTHRIFVTNGTLTAGSAGTEVFLVTQCSATADGTLHLGVGATITDNGNPVNLVRGGEAKGASVYLSGTNTYTGKTVLSVSSLQSGTGVGGVFVMTERQFGPIPSTPMADKMLLNGGFIRNSSSVPFSWTPERGITLGGNGGQIDPGNYNNAILSAPITGPGFFAFSAAGGNVETTLSGANTFDGPVYAGGGNAAMNYTSIGNISSTTPTALGTPSNAANGLIRQGTPGDFDGMGNNMFWVYVGAGAATTDRSFEFNNGSNGALGASGTGTLTINGNVYLDAPNGTVGYNMTGSGYGILNGNIIQTTNGDSPLRKNAGGGTWRLAGQNTYTGITTISAGALEFTTIGNVGSGPSSLGAPTTTGPTGTGTILFGNSGLLRFVGSANQASDRILMINQNLYSPTGIEASGAGGAVLTLTGGVSSNQSSNTCQFTFGGTGTGIEKGVIAKGTSTNNTAVYKSGPGTWTFSQSSVNTYSGSTNVNGGTLILDYANLASPSNLIDSASTLILGGGNLSLLAKGSGATTQTLASLTMTANTGSQITLNGNGGTGLTLNTGGWNRGGGSTLNISGFSASTPVNVLTGAAGLTNGLLPYATTNSIDFATIVGTPTSAGNATSVVNNATFTFANSFTAGQMLVLGTAPTGLTANSLYYVLNPTSTTFQLATAPGGTAVTPTAGGTTWSVYTTPVTLGTYSTYTTLPQTGGSTTGTYTLGGSQAQNGNTALFALKITPDADGRSLALGAYTLGVGSTGGATILYDGTAGNYGFSITGTSTATVGSAGQELYAHVARGTLDIGAPLGNTTAAFDKAGAGTLILSGNNTYTGQTNVNAGTLQAGSATAFSPNSIMNVNIGTILALNGNSVTTGPLTGTGTVTNGAATEATLYFGNNTSGGTYAFGDSVVTLPLRSYGLLTDGAGGKLHINKIGSNLQILTGANTFTGNVTVGEGILAVPVLTDAGVAGPLGAGSTITLGSPSRQGGIEFYGTHNGATNRAITLATGGVGVLDVFNTVNNAALPLASAGAQTLFGDTALFSGNIAGSGQLAKTGLGNLMLSGTNNYTGRTNVVSGLLQFNNAAAIGGSGRSILVMKNGTVAAGYAMNQAFLNRIDTASTGVVALGANTAENLDLSALPNVSLGADQNFSLTGSLIPANSTYKLGGGTGVLMIQKANVLTDASPTSARNLLVSPNNTHQATVVISDAQNYTGTTTVQGTIYPAVSNGTLFSIVDSPATLILAGGAAGIASTSAININSQGTLRMVASAGDASNNKLGTTAQIAMNGGTLEYRNDGSAFNFAQTIGAVAINRGQNSVLVSATTGLTSVLTLTGLSRTSGSYATVDFNLPIAPTTAQIVVPVGTAALGEWATYGAQAGFADINVVNNQIIKATETAGTGAMTGFASLLNYTILGGATYTAGSGTARTIRITTGGSQANTTLSLGASDILSVNALMGYSAGNTPLFVGNVANQGTVQPASGNDLYVYTNGASSPMTINAKISLPSGGALIKGGSLSNTNNTLTLACTSNAYDNLVINTGVVAITAAGALPTAAAITLNGGQLIPFGSTFGGSITVNADASLGGNGVNYTQTGPITLNNNAMLALVSQGGSQSLSGAISGSGGLYFGDINNNASLTISGTVSNTYDGPTWFYGSPTGGNTYPTVTLSKTGGAIAIPGDIYLGWQSNCSAPGTIGGSAPRNERLVLGTAGTGGNQIKDTAVIYFSGGALADAGDFELNAKSETIAGIHSQMIGDGLVQNTAGTASTLTLAPQAGKTYNFSGTIRDGGAGKLGIILNGDTAGTQILSSANTYTGGTVITAGTLVAANTTGSATGTGTVKLDGGVLASGLTGTISGPVTASPPSAANTIAPGGLSSVGTLNLTNTGTALTLADYSTLNFDIVGATADLLAITGQLSITSFVGDKPKITLNSSALSGNYTLATYATSAGISNSSFTLPAAPAGYDWLIDTLNIRLMLANSTWANSSGGDWATAVNWSPNTVPNGQGTTANFKGNSPAASVTVNVNGAQTVGRLFFNQDSTFSTNYSIGGDAKGVLTMNNTGGANGPKAFITATAGSHEITSQVKTATDLEVSVSEGGTLNLSGGIDNTVGKTVTLSQAGGGTLAVGNVNNIGAGLLDVASGTVAANAISGSGSTTVNGSLTADSIVQGTLSIGSGGVVTIRETTGGSVSSVPEPGTWVLIGTALLGWLVLRRRR